MRCGGVALVILGSVAAGPSLAKNDIRGVATAQPLRDAVETLEWDGARCEPPDRDTPTVCTYDDRTSMTLYSGAIAPRKVEKLVYTFYFKDLAKMREKLQQLYGLGRGHIEGEHKLFTGERLDIELSREGTGSLSITNDRLVRTNAAVRRP